MRGPGCGRGNRHLSRSFSEPPSCPSLAASLSAPTPRFPSPSLLVLLLRLSLPVSPNLPPSSCLTLSLPHPLARSLPLLLSPLSLPSPLPTASSPDTAPVRPSQTFPYRPLSCFDFLLLQPAIGGFLPSPTAIEPWRWWGMCGGGGVASSSGWTSGRWRARAGPLRRSPPPTACTSSSRASASVTTPPPSPPLPAHAHAHCPRTHPQAHTRAHARTRACEGTLSHTLDAHCFTHSAHLPAPARPHPHAHTRTRARERARPRTHTHTFKRTLKLAEGTRAARSGGQSRCAYARARREAGAKAAARTHAHARRCPFPLAYPPLPPPRLRCDHAQASLCVLGPWADLVTSRRRVVSV